MGVVVAVAEGEGEGEEVEGAVQYVCRVRSHFESI